MGLIDTLLRRRDDTAAALYDAVVARGRATHWYLDGAVPDTLEGRFETITTVLAIVLLRLETDEGARALSVRLTEHFVEDMDGQLRQIGIGDLMVGKHMGKMMALLGGRLGALRDAFAAGDLAPVLVRNLYRGDPPEGSALAHVQGALIALRDELARLAVAQIAAGQLP